MLLKFERTEPQIEYLLRTECLLRPGTAWLFKLASDGLAYESRGMRVRADSKYVLVSSEPLAHSDVARDVELTCQGTHAVLLDMPSALTPEWEQALRHLHVTQAKSIEVWPAGLAAVAWDGEGHGEWLASETPTLAIRSDHPIDELTIAMGEGGSSLSLALSDTPPGEPVFIECPPLPIGLHKFSIAARSGSGSASEVVGDLDVVMRVRAARPWSPGVTTHGPLEVELDPAAPSLEQLWEGKAAVVVRGPPGRQVKCRVQMFTRAAEGPSFQRQLPPVTLPLASEEWTRYFETNLKALKDAQHTYDNARVCEAEFFADELGVFNLRCEREFTPLRWSLRRDASGFIVRLHDDTGSGVPVIERYSFERPTVGEKLPQGAESKAPRTGGLYVATLGDFKASIIVPQIGKDFASLRCEPRIDSFVRSAESISQLLTFASLWARGRLSGDIIAGYNQRLVIRTMTAHILSLLAGRAWARAESSLKDERGLVELKRCISDKGYELRLGAGLELEYKLLTNLPPAKRAERLGSLAENCGLVPPGATELEVVGRFSSSRLTVVRRAQGVGPTYSTWLAEFALRMASDPASLEAWAGQQVGAGIKKLLDFPALARAARFLVLAVDQQKKQAVSGEIYAGWRWSS